MVLGFTGKDSGKDSNGARPDPAPLQQIRGYWESLRIGGHLPERARIDPRGIAGALEHAFLIERISSGLAKFRLCGMQLHDVMGMEPAGMPLSVLFGPEARSRLGQAIEQTFDGPAVLDIWMQAERGIGRPPLAARMMILPVLDGAGDLRLALGGMVTAGAIGRQPRRFAIESLLTEPLPKPAAPRPRLAETLPDFAEPPAPYAARPDAPGKPAARPQLRLISSRD